MLPISRNTPPTSLKSSACLSGLVFVPFLDIQVVWQDGALSGQIFLEYPSMVQSVQLAGAVRAYANGQLRSSGALVTLGL